ncbi:acyltransferase family protein [Asticcacaulis sp. AND118]|uniref:acyltransferase family protein n=1 Tax=Asticcacaulis sp. AND118 TaxID=2840468 RepID=UPI001CFF671E|nr:acyltransferase family protein [Asticcacaulis sp. AND118]UDF04461.1 acyltransferase family protein [Asticcacaulis sp. AND118]
MTHLMQTEEGARFHALDAVRGGALFLGVVLHAGLAYMSPPAWIVNDPSGDAAVGPLFFTIHMFRMSLFFLLAGFFARLLYQKRGAMGFAVDRLKRVAAPLGIFWFPVLAAIITVAIMAALKANPSLAHQPAPPPPPLTVGTFPLTHLWFLYMLLLLYAVLVPLRGLLAFIDSGGGLRRAADSVFRGVLKSGAAPIVFGLPLWLVIQSQPQWQHWLGIPTPDTGLIPNIIAITGYATAFIAGWCLNRNADLLETLHKQWLINLISAIAFTVAAQWLGGRQAEMEAGAWRALYAGAYVLGLWTWSLGLTGMAVQCLNRPSRFWRYVADSSYWVYLVHLPFVLVLQYLLLDLAAPYFVKLPLAVFATLFLSLLSYQLLVRYSFIGAILNGRKRPSRKARQTPVNATA